MRIMLASWLLEVSQGESLTKVNAGNRLLSYFHTIEKADQLPKYVITGRNKPAIIKRNYEIWKNVKGFPGYQISCFGRVKSLKRNINIIIRSRLLSNGYVRIGIQRKGKQLTLLVHLLVLTHFGPPKPSIKHQCNHKDTDKTNNWWTNLEWMTSKENTNHAIDKGKRGGGEMHPLAIINNKKVKRIRKLYSIKKYKIREIAKKLNINENIISKVVHNKTWRNV